MADPQRLEAARNIACDWIDMLGKAYERNGSSKWKPLPTWQQFCEAVLAIYAVLTPPVSLADYERDGTRIS